MRWAGRLAWMGRGEAYTRFWWETLRERDYLRTSRRREDNIKIDLHEVGCECMDWIELTQDKDRWLAIVNAVMSLRVP